MADKKLHISDALSLPLEVVTQKLAWLGVTGSGKTYGAIKMAELLWEHHAQQVILDPVGVWYGMRLAKDGKGPGIPIPVFGGLHGDVPLEPTSGAMVADLIVDKDLSVILDVSQMESDTQKARFVSDFAERFFQRKKANPGAVHVFLEEAQEFVPQNPQRGEEMMLHRLHRMQKLGRNFGIGTSLITQRPQETSKKALNQAQTVMAFRLTGSQERKAVEEWLTGKGMEKDVLAGLPAMATGNCHVWSPAWLQVFKQVRIAAKDTFDASATPRVGERKAARTLAPIDLERIRTEMAATIEKAKADDPKALRAKVAELERKLSRAAVVVAEQHPVTVEKVVERYALKDGQLKRLEALAEKLDRVAKNTAIQCAATMETLDRIKRVTSPLVSEQVSFHSLPRTVHLPRAHGKEAFTGESMMRKRIVADVLGLDKSLPPARKRILNALRFIETTLRTSNADKVQLAFLADQSPNSGGYKNNLGALKSAGYIHYPTPGKVSLTEHGRLAAEDVDVPRTNDDLHAIILAKLPPAKQNILKVLIANHPNALPKGDLAEAAGQAHTSGGYKNNLGALRSLGVLDYPTPGNVRASDLLFLEA